MEIMTLEIPALESLSHWVLRPLLAVGSATLIVLCVMVTMISL